MSDFIPSLQFEEEIRAATAVPQADEKFIKSLQNRLNQQAAVQRKVHRPFSLRPAWAITLLILLVMTITTLVIGPQKVYAEFLKLFGYVPGIGFVDLSQVRVLQNGVTQRHTGQEVTAVRGVVSPHGTDIWLEFSDEARPVADAWLETADSQHFALLNWSYDHDKPGTHGVVMHFATLPESVNEVTLRLVEGWSLPLVWVQGTGSIKPANIVLVPNEALAETSIPATSLCSQAFGVQFCIQAAVRTTDGLQVLLEATPNEQYATGSGFSPSMFDLPGKNDAISLMTNDGHVYPFEPNSIQVGGEPSGSQSTLLFPGVQDLHGDISLQIPAVMLFVPLTDKISINLGDHPTAGQALTIDQTVDVAGNPVHFSQAELISGNFGNSLMLKITSDPVEAKDGATPYIIDPGRPEGIQDRYGAGSEDGRLSLRVELIQQTGSEPVNGILDIPLVSASILVQGPFNLSFDAASVQELPTPQPPVVAESTFEPLPLGNPLPMDAYHYYTGRVLQHGDLLSITFDGVNSTLYAASPSNNFTPEEVAVLPGNVLVVYAQPDLQGIDYITGSYDVDTSDTVYRQLYTLRFGDPAPRLLIGQLENAAYFFNWSFDGRFLSYQVTDDRPGQSYQRYLRILDLDCRATGNCQYITADTSNQDLFFMSWSPIDYRLALGGTPADQKFGANDILLLTLNPDNHQTTLTNLTQSPTINDWAPAQWTPGGDILYFACETGKEASVNEYSLCRNNLVTGEDEVVTGKLPWNMHSIHLGAGRWVVDNAVVMENSFFNLRSYDLQTGQESTILKWSVVGKHQVDTAISADGHWLAAYVPEQGGLLALNVLTHVSVTVMPADLNPSFFTWVK